MQIGKEIRAKMLPSWGWFREIGEKQKKSSKTTQRD